MSEAGPEDLDDTELIAHALEVTGMSVHAMELFLGCKHPSFQRYVRGQRPLPPYIRRSLEAHLRLLHRSPADFKKLIRRRSE